MIIIKGRHTPRCCADCPCLHKEGMRYCQAKREFNRITAPYAPRPKWCPIMEVKKA